MLKSLHSGAYRCAVLTPVRLKKGTQRTMAAAATDAPERKQLMSVAPMCVASTRLPTLRSLTCPFAAVHVFALRTHIVRSTSCALPWHMPQR